jgi:DeoR family glycerol-3-phosphate regulon repressor
VRPSDRHENIIKLVHKTGEVSVDALAEQLGASRETIRRDLANLDALGRLRKFHGGARVRSISSLEPSVEGPFALRLVENSIAKRRIAHRAAAILSPGDAVFIDTGTTTLMLAEALVNLPPLVIITNSWKIAATASGNSDHKVFLIGGYYGADAGESVGNFAVEQIRKFRARHAFLTVGALDETCVMDFDAQEAEIAQAMIERVEEVTILADASKFSKRGIFEVAQWDVIDRLVTDRRPPPPIESAMISMGTEIVEA